MALLFPESSYLRITEEGPLRYMPGGEFELEHFTLRCFLGNILIIADSFGYVKHY